jgi:hypothetical protein
MHDLTDDGKRPDRLDLLLTDYFRPEMAGSPGWAPSRWASRRPRGRAG